jgi:hypothetical protein
MAISEDEMKAAERRMRERREAGYACSARYEAGSGRIVIGLSTDVQIAIPVSKIEGLVDASPEQLAEIEISEAGLGLHWPELDVDIYIPAILQGVFGSPRWMAAQLGALGGSARSDAKAASARENGRKGGRPRRSAAS